MTTFGFSCSRFFDVKRKPFSLCDSEILEIGWTRFYSSCVLLCPYAFKTTNPSILKSGTKRTVRIFLLLRKHGTLPSYSGNICSHTHSYILYISPCWHRNSYPHSLPRFQSYDQLHDMLLVSFLLLFFFSPVTHMWTSLFCIDLDPDAGLLKIWAFCFCFTLGPEWVEWGVWVFFFYFIFLFCCVCVFFILFYFPPVSSSIIRRPSSKQG